MTDIAVILAERKKTHGEYRDHARVTWRLKTEIRIELGERRQRGQGMLSYIQNETLDMIAHKIGRIIAGDADEPDHWDDIAGYAKLVADRLREDAALNIMKEEIEITSEGEEFDDRH